MKTWRYSAGLTLLLGLITWLYWPGLQGGWLFDDEANIVSNTRVAIKSLSLPALQAAAWSGAAGPLGRPLSMLSFALNHYFTGFDPFYFKLTNLVIHLGNTLLVFGLVFALLHGFLRQPSAPARLVEQTRFPLQGALIAAALWGLHPINLTSILYAVQRMTSLSALFGLAALTLYSLWRAFASRYTPARILLVTLGVALLVTASLLSKESGALFVPLLVFIELVVFQGKTRDGKILRFGPLSFRQLAWLLATAILLAGLWKLPDFIRPENFYNRDFTLTERLMTEARVLFYYLRLLFTPTLSELALFHDDFVISRSLWQPPATLLAILGLIAISLASLLAYRKYPLWAFAWGWFLISHALESTVISLELVHEHRNYFATLGIFTLAPWLLFSLPLRFRRLGFILLGGYLLLFGFVTWQRTQIWQTYEELALFEVESHPNSDRAHYQLGWVYMRHFMQKKDPELARLSLEQMHQSMQTPYPSNGAWFAALHIAFILNEPVDPKLISQLEQRLRESPSFNSNLSFLEHLGTCQEQGYCKLPHETFISLCQALIDNKKTSALVRARTYLLLSRYYIFTDGNAEKGEALLKKALATHEDANTHLLLADLYTVLGRFAKARQHLQQALNLDTKKAWGQRVQRLRQNLEKAEQEMRKWQAAHPEAEGDGKSPSAPSLVAPTTGVSAGKKPRSAAASGS